MPAAESYNREDQFGPMFQVCEYCTPLEEIGVVYELPYGQIPSANPVIRRAYLDDWVRRNGGLGYWNASNGSITVSGGGDPVTHGVYNYVGHYAGKPVYQKGNFRIANVDQTWMLFEIDGPQYYNGNGGVAYPSQVDWWSSMFGNVYNVPTFTRGWGGGVSIPRWPKGDVPPGPMPLSSAWSQRDYVYQPMSGPPVFTQPVGNSASVGGNSMTYFLEDEAGKPEFPLESDDGKIVRGIDMMPPVEDDGTGGGIMAEAPVPVPTTYYLWPDGSLQDVPPPNASTGNPLASLLAADGTIFGFSPLLIGAVVVGALFLFSGGKK